MPKRYVPTATRGEDGETIPQNPTPSYVSGALPNPAAANVSISRLACPVPNCSFVLKPGAPDGYLWRHIKNPKNFRCTGGDEEAWLQLHKAELDRLEAAGATPARRKREANKVRARRMREQKRLRAGFELRARNMGIREELVAQKVAIWEGMSVARWTGDSTGAFPRFRKHSRARAMNSVETTSSRSRSRRDPSMLPEAIGLLYLEGTC
ncbi:unnamed protein product [Tuber aestivum]|uniref:Uncharacterized protein n=1 Tax=Tuber aestivum TaxID=59557 RepID=A0A292PQD6_9PEZI|nr:unnamed protein product [Tuber aestivum]